MIFFITLYAFTANNQHKTEQRLINISILIP